MPFFDRLAESIPKFMAPLGAEYQGMKCGPLWIAARGLREVERFDRRMTETDGEKSPLDAELAESLRTTVRLVTDAIKEWRSSEASPIADSFKKKLGEQAASALGFSIHALV